MIVVSDNGPIGFLVQIGRVDLLPRLYGEVLIPPAVLAELQRAKTPVAVREWLAAGPSWLTVESPMNPVENRRPDWGEREAIQLARERSALLLCDDRDAVRDARNAGLVVTGTLGVLRDAHGLGLTDIQAALSELRGATEFRFPPASFVAAVVSEAETTLERAKRAEIDENEAPEPDFGMDL